MEKATQNKILNYLYKLKSFGITYHELIDIKKDMSLVEFSKDIVENCMLCDASKLCNNKIIEDQIDENKKLIIISNIHISNHNEMELLSNMTKNVLGLDMEHLKIINLIKCNINPNQIKTEYINQCISYAYKELDQFKPNIPILFLGTSYNHITKKSIALEEFMGKILEYRSHKSLILPELDFIIKNPSIKKDLLSGLNRIKLYLEKM